MTVTAGTRIGPYQLTEPVGAGGMGEVWRARDTKLGRDVAIKILPAAFAADAERTARFEREARLLAALNHPNIATIHGVEDTSAVVAIVMELVDGLTLADILAGSGLQNPRLQAHVLPLSDALNIARQLTEALDAAHEKGIVHRDLKPANIKVTPNGVVKVLDFGLAKAAEAVAAGQDPELTHSPTMLPSGTQAGVILGTAAYMSPEQARGLTVDKRADIWAFGCVLYEMLTGRQPFVGATVTDILAAIIGREPDWSALPIATPEQVKRLLRRCLDKDVRRRMRDIGDARLELDEEALRGPSAPVALSPVSARRTGWLWVAGAVAIAAVAGLTSLVLARRGSSETPGSTVHLSLSFLERPSAGPFGRRHLAISEDGSHVAYAASNRLWIRRMDQNEAVALGGEATNPFFSPDGKWIGFFGATSVLKVPVDGGNATLIARTTDRPAGAAWRADGAIVFATTEGLYQASDAGGEARLLIRPDRQKRERLYAWPQFTPDGQSVLFTILSEDSGTLPQIGVLDLRSLQPRIILSGGAGARYVATGHLVYATGATLKAIAFDPGTGQVRGGPVSLPGIEVATAPDNGAANFAISATGTLVFTPVGASGIVPGDLALRALRTLQWVDRNGKKEPVAIQPGSFGYPRVSPDGTRVALDVTGDGNRDIWILDLKRLSLTQLTNGPTEDLLPEWSPDGRRVFFASDRAGNFDIYSQAADGAAGPRLEFAAPGFQTPQGFTPDGTRVLVYELFKDIGVLTLGQPDHLEPLLHSEADKRVPRVSPDGRWMVYESNESGKQFEIFLRPFPNVGDRREKISVDGGRFPRWNRKGSEIDYVNLDGAMMAASVTLSPTLQLGAVTKLFDYQKPPAGRSGHPYDVSPLDGRFLITEPVGTDPGGPSNVSVVLNWFPELTRALAPARN